MKTKLLVLFGGRSGEYEVSLVSAGAVLNHIDTEKYDIITVGITREGKWLYYTGDYEKIPTNEWVEDFGNLPCAVSPDYGKRQLIVFGEYTCWLAFDAAIAVMHGTQGEDGTLQGMFELAGIPLAGCSAETSANCMDKAIAKVIMKSAGIRTARGINAEKYQWASSREDIIRKAESTVSYPMFVKPSRAGSSVGVSKAADRGELEKALDLAFEWDKTALIEECIVGREIEVAVLVEKDGKLTVSEPGEIDPGNVFYDYDTKYKADTAKYYIPARLTEDEHTEVITNATKAVTAFGITGLSRIDFFVTADHTVIMNEINTMPGFTPISMYPQLMNHIGIGFDEIVDRIITESL